MVVVTINILVIHPQSEETYQEVRSADLLQLEEPVLSEEEERSFKKTSDLDAVQLYAELTLILLYVTEFLAKEV
jgi:hypothetical protein